MNWLNLLGLSVGLAMDAFAVSIAAGLSIASVTPRHTFRIPFHFGLFQFMMPILGWLAGGRAAAFVGAYDHWVAFGLLCLVGGKMLQEAFRKKQPEYKTDPTRGLMLVMLCLATSIDALAVGVSMAFMQVSVWVPCVVIGIVAAALSTVGISFAGRFPRSWRSWAEAAGGCVLVLIGVRILVTHLAG